MACVGSRKNNYGKEIAKREDEGRRGREGGERGEDEGREKKQKRKGGGESDL